MNLWLLPSLPNQKPHNIKPGIWVKLTLLVSESRISPKNKPYIKPLIDPWFIDQGNIAKTTIENTLNNGTGPNGIESESINQVNEIQEETASSEAVNHKQEPELIAVTMDLKQQNLFGWLGLSQYVRLLVNQFQLLE